MYFPFSSFQPIGLFLTRKRDGVETRKGIKTRRHEDAKARSFLKTKLLNVGKWFQPFEPIEPIEPFELFFLTRRSWNTKARKRDFFDTKTQRLKGTNFFKNKVAKCWKMISTFWINSLRELFLDTKARRREGTKFFKNKVANKWNLLPTFWTHWTHWTFLTSETSQTS